MLQKSSPGTFPGDFSRIKPIQPGTIYPELYFLFVRKSGLYHYRTFQSLLLKSARELVRFEDSVIVLHIVCVAAAAAVELRPAIRTLFFGIYICF